MAKSRARPPLCFELIKSLDRAEKSYFTRHHTHSSKGKPTIYIKLFDAMDKMKEYDAEKLKRKFKEEKFINHLAAHLSNLYGLLLSSLVDYKTNSDDVLTAYEMLGKIRILFQKRLYNQCERQIRLSRRFFEEREYYRYLYLLASYEYSLTVIRIEQDEIIELMQITKERRSYLKKLDDELLIFELCDQLHRYDRQKQLNPNQDFRKQITDLAYQHKELQSRFKSGSTTFKLFHMQAAERLYLLKNQQIESLRASHRYVRLRLDLSAHLRYSHEADLEVLGNHLTKSLDMWFVDEVEYWLPEVKAIATQDHNLQHRADLITVHFRFQLLLLHRQFDELTNLVRELMDKLDVFLEKNVPYYHVLLFEDLALYHFLIGNFRESLEWIERIFAQKDTDDWVRKLTINTRLMEIMIHFNLKSYQLIPSRCLSTKRFIINNLRQADNEFVEELKWLKNMNLLGKYILPKQTKDFVETLLPEAYFDVPPNERLVLMSVWGEAQHKGISLRESWTQHTENIIAKMKSATGMDVLYFEKENENGSEKSEG